MLVTLDGTPLLGRRTGIGRYVQELLVALPQVAAERAPDVRFRVTTWSARSHRVPDLPPEVRQVGPRVPARALRAAWLRTDLPTAEMLGAGGDVVHGTNFVVPPTRRAAAVVTVHDLTFLDRGTVAPTDADYAQLLPRSLDRGAHVVTPTRAVAAAVRAHYGLPADRVDVTPLGVDDAWFSAAPPGQDDRDRLGLPDDYVLYVGSDAPRKNVDTLVAAHRALTEGGTRGPALVLAGPAGAALRADAHPGVVAGGWLADEDLRRLVAGARAVVLPSSDEGFGLPVLEALAAGRPVVITDIPALTEVAGPHGGAVAPPRDADALAGAVQDALAADDSDAARTRRRDWARGWTWPACAAATLDVYQRVAAAR
jgi:glycosyltransferase involved in cell wall biosynthesis